jgi:5-(carboxyamino)imidazole ribonucleotide synthase
VERLGFPSVLKTRRLGYDGRGQWVLRGPADVASAREALGGSPAILEEFVRFERELSMIAVRGQAGEIAFYPPIENHHRDGILRVSRAPAPGITPALRARAEDYARRLIETLGHVGVLALEMFQSGDALVANEIAPRVHNTGHWTIEGARTSQFENHLRAIAGMPLGPTDARGHSAMVNLIGTIPDLSPLAGTPGVHVHRYGKQPRPGRKLGHITVCADDAGMVDRRLAAVLELVAQTGAPAFNPRASG